MRNVRMLAVAVVVVVAASCRKPAVASYGTTNGDIPVEVLFEVDGFRVYRFVDSEAHYFVVPSGTVIAQHRRSCGKACTYTEDDEIATVRP